jgi:mono/diheme cytochrome c family protein
MRMTKLAVLIVTIAVALFILIPNLSWAAEDGAALYKAKCAACHGPNAEGKPAIKAPALKSEDVKKKSDDDLAKFLASNPKHAGVAKALNADQTKAVVSYIRELNK